MKTKKKSSKLDNLMSAITFAEANETEIAREYLKEAADVDAAVPAETVFSRTMEAVAFAEAGEHEHAQSLVKRPKVKTVKSRAQDTMEAITFAEAGEHEHARELLQQDSAAGKKLLVVGGEQGFSQVLVNHAVGMAQRMKYEIAAVNVVPVGSRLLSFLSDSVKANMAETAEKAAEEFKNAAAAKEIPFNHIVKFGDVERAIQESHRELRRVAFILSEPDQVCEQVSTSAGVPVFCLSDFQAEAP